MVFTVTRIVLLSHEENSCCKPKFPVTRIERKIINYSDRKIINVAEIKFLTQQEIYFVSKKFAVEDQIPTKRKILLIY